MKLFDKMRQRMGQMGRKGAMRVLAAMLCVLFAAGSMPIDVQAYEYTYKATFHAGDQGKFTSGVSVWVNNRATGSKYQISRAADGSTITVSGLKSGDVVTVDVTAPGALYIDPDSNYYVKGIRPSGYDNAEASYGAFTVTKDQDFVVAYGMRTDATTYTVYYCDLDGNKLVDPMTTYGNVGDKPVAAYVYIPGWTPLTYNLTKTLVADPSQNVLTFYYKKDEGVEVKVEVPGETQVIHIPGGTYEVHVPGETIIQYTGTGEGGGNGTVNDTGTVSGGSQGGNGGSGQVPSTVTYVLNSNSKKMHEPTCSYAANIEPEYRIDSSDSYDNLVADGWIPCEECNPKNKPAASGGNGSGNNGTGNSNGGGNSNNGGDVSGTGTQGQRPNGDGGEGGDDGSGGVSGTGTQGQRPNGEGSGGEGGTVSGTGTQGSRPTGNGSGDGSSDDGSNGGYEDGTGAGNGTGSDETGDGTGSGVTYKPGGSLDVVLTNDYVPAPIVDLDENPTGVPMEGTPDMNGDGTEGDPAQDGMNENTEGTGTGSGSADGELPVEKKGSALPWVIGGIVVLAGVGAAVFVLYKKQQSAGSGDDE